MEGAVVALGRGGYDGPCRRVVSVVEVDRRTELEQRVAATLQQMAEDRRYFDANPEFEAEDLESNAIRLANQERGLAEARAELDALPRRE